MLRASWTGSISFGLVAIPVKAVPAQSPKDISFEQLHRECNSKLTTRRFCPKCDREVGSDEIVRGYQYAKGEYVLFEKDETEQLVTPAKSVLQILDFVQLTDIDPVFFEKPYYLQPAPGGERTYALLHRAMAESGRVGVGKVALRERESLAVIRPMEHALVMEIIAFPDEVRAVEDAVQPFEAQVDDRELKMAHFLIDQMTAEFQPEKYRDDYRDALTALIQSKVEGGTVRVEKAPDRAQKGEVVDLMEMLRRSVELTQGEGAAEKTPAAAAKPEKRERKRKAA